MPRTHTLALLAALAVTPLASAFTLQGAGLDPADFRVTTFADGLNFPLGMAELEDGSIVTVVSNGTSFGGGTGSIVRLADTDGDGVSDVQQMLVSDVAGGRLTSVRRAGDLLVVTGQSTSIPISFYRLGATPSDPLTELGQLTLTYPGTNWSHPHSSLQFRETPAGVTGDYELYFQIGSDANLAETTRTVELGGDLGLTATLVGEAIHRITLTDGGPGGGLTADSNSVVATGLRNATGIVFHPVTGDLYLGENGIDGVSDPNEPTSPDEINVVPAADLYGPAEDFGFHTTYVEYRTGVQVGSDGLDPLVNIQPLPSPNGEEAEGVNEIAFAPALFPEPLAGGIFAGFHGKFSLGGVANEENPLVFIDLDDNSYFHTISNDEPDVGHLDGLLSTGDTLYVSDMSPGGNFGAADANTGKIYAITAVVTPGDFNRDGVVDAADYLVWRETNGQSGLSLAADGNGDYQVTQADYEIWREAYGGSAASVATPEPGALGLALMAFVVTSSRRRTLSRS